MENYSIAAFRSRQAVFRFEARLRSLGIPSIIISTPRAVSLGCGLSLRFNDSRIPSVLAAYDADPVPNLVGFYSVQTDASGIQVSPLRKT